MIERLEYSKVVFESISSSCCHSNAHRDGVAVLDLGCVVEVEGEVVVFVRVAHRFHIDALLTIDDQRDSRLDVAIPVLLVQVNDCLALSRCLIGEDGVESSFRWVKSYRCERSLSVRHVRSR